MSINIFNSTTYNIGTGYNRPYYSFVPYRYTSFMPSMWGWGFGCCNPVYSSLSSLGGFCLGYTLANILSSKKT